jgi:TrpR-related protein YerC/YecD
MGLLIKFIFVCMSRFSINKLQPKQQAQVFAEFYDIITSLNGKDEVQLFLQDLLTMDEIAMLMRRIEVATLLRAGFSYEQITNVLGVGKPKITNVQHSLQKNNSGYDIVIKKLLIESGYKKGRVVKSKNSEYEKLKKIPYSGLYLIHVMEQIGGLLEETFNSEGSSKNQKLISRMPTRRR